MNKKILVGMGVVQTLIVLVVLIGSHFKKEPAPIVEVPVTPIVEESKPIVIAPLDPAIEDPMPKHLSYDETRKRLELWASQAPELTEFGVYGKSERGKELVYLRVGDERHEAERPVVLITACIHGNEPWSASVVMAYIGALLDRAGQDERVNTLLKERYIYFVPVVSPDSYPQSRHVDGVDPNRNFPGSRDINSVAPVAAIQKFFLDIDADAVISAHTWGRVYLTPYGDTMENPPHKADYDLIVGEMAELSQYRMIRACDLYLGNGRLNNPPIRALGQQFGEFRTSVPIYGTEIDWYYKHSSGERGGKGAFAIVMEMGTHQRIPSMSDTRTEFDRTFDAVLVFCEKAPLVEIKH